MKRKFFDTIFAQMSGINIGVVRMLKYVVVNQSSVYTHDEITEMAQQVRSILKTPLSEFFGRMVAKGALFNFAAIDVSKDDTSIPELLTMSNVTIDLGHLPNSNDVLQSLPTVQNKILLNLTGAARRDHRSGSIVVTNADILQNLFVRGQLVATYHDDNNDWLVSNSSLALFVLKSYSMILSAIIARYYNLGIEDIQKVATICALHMDCLLGGTIERPIYINRWDWCPAFGMRRSLVDACGEHAFNGDFNLISMCQALAALVSVRMQKFNLDTFFGLCGRLGPDLITSRIALEYPPYWVFILLSCLGGSKIPLVYHLNKDKNLMKDGNIFLNSLMLNNSVLDIRN